MYGKSAHRGRIFRRADVGIGPYDRQLNNNFLLPLTYGPLGKSSNFLLHFLGISAMIDV